METGVAMFATHDAVAPAELARLAEQRGHESLFFPEHTHIPASRQTPWPGGRPLPRRYAHTFDLFVVGHGRAGRDAAGCASGPACAW